MSIGAIDTSRIEAMVAQLRAAAAGASPSTEQAQKSQPAGGVDFASALKSSLDHVNQSQQAATSLAQRFETGDTTVSLSDAMIALQKSSISFQQTVQVRNKLVSAYQEIMAMGV